MSKAIWPNILRNKETVVSSSKRFWLVIRKLWYWLKNFDSKLNDHILAPCLPEYLKSAREIFSIDDHNWHFKRVFF